MKVTQVQSKLFSYTHDIIFKMKKERENQPITDGSEIFIKTPALFKGRITWKNHIF